MLLLSFVNDLTSSSKYFAGTVRYSSLGLLFFADIDLFAGYSSKEISPKISFRQSFKFGHLLSAFLKRGFIHCIVNITLVLGPQPIIY